MRDYAIMVTTYFLNLEFGGYIAWTSLGGAFGFWYYNAQQRQLEKIERRRQTLLEKREQRQSKESTGK